MSGETIWFALIIASVFGIAATYEWLHDKFKTWKALQKSNESETVNLYGMHLSEDFIYTRELERRIKESREELRMLMKQRNGGEEI